jgi:hypothetical protein
MLKMVPATKSGQSTEADSLSYPYLVAGTILFQTKFLAEWLLES